MYNTPKKIAQKILLHNRIMSKPDIEILQKLITINGFTIIPYNKYSNSNDTNDLIEKLNIENMIATKDSFMYLSDNIRIVFINQDLSTPDKEILLRHELGHICDPNINLPDHQYSKIKREDFANEFSHHLEHPTFIIKTISTFLKYRLFIILGALLVIISAFGIYFGRNTKTSIPASANNVNIETDIYYVTPTGSSYHRESCKHIKYRNNTLQVSFNDAVKDGYSPCLDCIGE